MLWKTARSIAAGSFADSLYALFGQPRAPIGLVGRRGRSAGRLGEYIASRDSLALDPARMTGQTQLRHTLAHELGHRWQARSRVQLGLLCSACRRSKIPSATDMGIARSNRQRRLPLPSISCRPRLVAPRASDNLMILLDRYELLVPGTRTMARYLSHQPLYRKHPLRSLLITGRI